MRAVRSPPPAAISCIVSFIAWRAPTIPRVIIAIAKPITTTINIRETMPVITMVLEDESMTLSDTEKPIAYGVDSINVVPLILMQLIKRDAPSMRAVITRSSCSNEL